MQTIEEISIARLKMLIDEYGSQAELANKIEKTSTRVSQWSTGFRHMSKKTKREIEKLTNKEIGWLDLPLSPVELNLGQSNINNGGNQTNIAGDQNNNSGGDQYNIKMSPMCEMHEKAKQSLPDNLIKAMPLLDIDEAIIYATSENPTIEIKENIRVGTFVPHSGRTFGLKMPDDSMQANGDEESIFKNDLLIIEPLIAPRDGDLVLVCLENDGQKRGLLARLELDIRGQKQLIQTGRGHIADAMPENAVICGVVIEIKRRLIALDVLEARLKAFQNL